MASEQLWQVFVLTSKRKWRQVRPSNWKREDKSAKYAAAKKKLDKLRKEGRKAKMRKVVKDPIIVKRSQWGARMGRAKSLAPWGYKTATVVHHTVTEAPKKNRKAEEKAMRGIQAFHLDGRGWSDIAYNFLIMPSGRIYEGRGKGVRNAASGSNRWNVQCAIAFVGDYSKKKPSKDAVDSYEWLRLKLGIDKGKELGHGDVYGTSCPGNGVRRALDL